MSIARKILMGSSGGKKSTYVDDVFSTYVYQGNETARAINNGIDLSSKGGLVWVKSRNDTHQHHLIDTVRGANEMIASDSDSDQATVANRITGFNNNGFNLGTAGQVNGTSAYNYSSWTFRKAEGFFDIVTYTGNSTAGRQIAHNLGSVPGCIMVKRLDDPVDWAVWHRGSAESNATNTLKLNTSAAQATNSSYFDNGSTPPTATNFTVYTSNRVNQNGASYVAYVFAGGELNAATARSVNFDGSSDYLHTASSSDLAMGTGDFTVEGWIKFKTYPTTHAGFYQISSNSNGLEQTYYGQTIGLGYSGDNWRIYGTGSLNAASDSRITVGDWYHVAHVRSSGVSKLYVNGKEVVSATDTYNYTGTYLAIGSYNRPTFSSNAYISNFRVVKGTAVYTSSFRPPTEPLTNITNTKVLCCNNTSTTGKTVGPTLTVQGTISASTDSPFDDPEGFQFGEGEDQNIIKCGSYIGSGQSTAGTGNAGPNINLGWEPQWIMVKCATDVEHWELYDSTRGIFTKPAGNQGTTEPCLEPNLTNAESQNERFSLTSTGFQIETGSGSVNGNGKTYIYICIRRPDGYVGKPPEAGTDAFATSMGSSVSPYNPSFISGWPVDMGIMRRTDVAQSWNLQNRLTGQRDMQTNTNAQEGNAGTNCIWDSMTGFFKNQGSVVQGWMWKRHAGFDVVTYKGNAVAGRPIFHSLSKTPEMIWLKSRTSADQWVVGHKGLNGGTNPWHYWLKLQSTDAESNSINNWNDQAPTSTHFIIDDDNRVNKDGDSFIAMLFASVDGISSVGSYSPTSSSTTVTCGFQPRFVIVKAATKDNTWSVADSLRGITAGNDPALALNENWENDKYGGADWIDVSATGFTVNSTGSGTADANSNGETYIYYAHA